MLFFQPSAGKLNLIKDPFVQSAGLLNVLVAGDVLSVALCSVLVLVCVQCGAPEPGVESLLVFTLCFHITLEMNSTETN